MSINRLWRCALVALLLASVSREARGGEREIRADLEAFFLTDDAAQRRELACRIESDPAYKRRKVTKYLHRADLFDQLEPGRVKFKVKLPTGPTRQVTLRVPPRYTPAKKLPLIYALHGGGSNADEIIRYVEFALGPEVNDFVVAAQTGHRGADFYPYEHPAVLVAVKRRVRVNSDRVYVMGYSAGGYGSWALAVLHPDLFAAAIPVAGALEIGRQSDDFLPNIANTFVLNVWGAEDNLKGWDAGVGVADANREMRNKAKRLDLPVDSYEEPGKAHFNVWPPRGVLMSALSRRREQYPHEVHHVFQHPAQARAYWLERNPGEGEPWPSPVIAATRLPGETGNQAIARALNERRGELHGKIEGQTITVNSTKADSLTIWIGDEMIDWDQPVRVIVADTEVFAGKLEPDLFVCLAQAARTYDFDRLRWAGLRVTGADPAELVTGETEFPPLLREP